ncbi:MAG: ABC transporter ATP-binding protein [Lachnospiraceae bacterium]
MKRRSNLNLVGRLLALVKPLLAAKLTAILMGVAGFVCATFLTIFGAYGILGLLGFSVPMTQKTIYTWLIIFAVCRGFLGYAEQYCNHYIAFHLLALLRDKMFTALRRLCPAKLEGKDKGDLISIITSDIEAVELFYAHTISPVSIAFIMSVIMVIFIGSFHVLAGVIAAIAYFTVGVLLPLFITKMGGDKGMDFRRRMGALNGFVLDSLRGLKEILQYGKGEERLEAINARTDDLASREEILKKENAFNSVLSGTLVWVFSAIMLFVCAGLYRAGRVDFTGVLIPFVAMLGSFGPVLALASLGSGLQQAFAAANRILDILDEEPQVPEKETGEELPAFTGAEARRVDFAYDTEQILTDFSMEVPKNQIIGIVGKSGSGKSTLLKLFMRFWDVDNGELLISGKNVSTVRTKDLRSMESFVTQDTQLFHDSIEHNIRIARLSASREEIEEACKKASIHDFIMTLPKGYDTNVGELGDSLSGGERQRIGLARAFLHEAPFVLLDEPTSNLDSLNEAVILKSLKESGTDRTIILVSHRESTMRIADTVYRVENGRRS